MKESTEVKMRAEAQIAERVRTLVYRYPALAPLGAEIRGACELLVTAFEAGRKLLVCGNGGSAADADHIVGELMKSFVLRRALAPELREKLVGQDTEMGARMAESLQQGLPAIALTQAHSLISAFANDADPALIYAQQVLGYGAAGDVFWGISTSGNAKNVVHAAVAARALGLKVIGMTGEGGGALAKFCDVRLAVPERETYKVQELHLPIYHAICLAVEASIFS
jgi:D-sedoheptulose 7-phosphate isomerase